MDALLGHGVALDNYMLTKQNLELARNNLENKKTESALKIIEEKDKDKLEIYKGVFCSYNEETP